MRRSNVIAGVIMLELLNVHKSYRSPQGAEDVTVLREVTLRCEKGDSIAIVGPSGSGKSTLLNIIGALDRPSSGQVMIDGRDIGQLADRELAEIRGSEIGFVFQLHHLLPQCTVMENVLVPTLAGRGRRSKRERNEQAGRAEQLLERVGLRQHLGHRPGELSAGQRQRAALARALINRPNLLLADEPTGSLDKETAGGVAELLVELNRQERTTLIVVTHSAALAERMGRVYELVDGKLGEKRGGR